MQTGAKGVDVRSLPPSSFLTIQVANALPRMRTGVTMTDRPRDETDLTEIGEAEQETTVYDLDASEDAGAATDDAREDLQQLVVYLATNLIDAPDDVHVSVERRGSAVHLRLQVPEEELGKVIGRQGRIARAMRTAVMIAGARHDVRASLDIEG